MKQKKEIRE